MSSVITNYRDLQHKKQMLLSNKTNQDLEIQLEQLRGESNRRASEAQRLGEVVTKEEALVRRPIQIKEFLSVDDMKEQLIPKLKPYMLNNNQIIQFLDSIRTEIDPFFDKIGAVEKNYLTGRSRMTAREMYTLWRDVKNLPQIALAQPSFATTAAVKSIPPPTPIPTPMPTPFGTPTPILTPMLVPTPTPILKPSPIVPPPPPSAAAIQKTISGTIKRADLQGFIRKGIADGSLTNLKSKGRKRYTDLIDIMIENGFITAKMIEDAVKGITPTPPPKVPSTPTGVLRTSISASPVGTTVMGWIADAEYDLGVSALDPTDLLAFMRLTGIDTTGLTTLDEIVTRLIRSGVPSDDYVAYVRAKASSGAYSIGAPKGYSTPVDAKEMEEYTDMGIDMLSKVMAIMNEAIKYGMPLFIPTNLEQGIRYFIDNKITPADADKLLKGVISGVGLYGLLHRSPEGVPFQGSGGLGVDRCKKTNRRKRMLAGIIQAGNDNPQLLHEYTRLKKRF